MAGDPARRETILLIGREPSLASALERELAAHGVGVRVYRDVDDALRAVWEQRAPVVVLDLTLPGVDGVRVSRSLKGEPAPPRILAIGTGGALVDLRRALRKEYRPDRIVLSSEPTARAVHEILELLRPLRPQGEAPAQVMEAGFAGMLVDLWRRSATGVLALAADEPHAEPVNTTLFFVNGEPVFAQHGALADSLGRTLVRTGLLTEAQLERAIARAKETAGPPIRLGEVLIELDMLSPNQVHDAIKGQVREKILSCFQWRTVAAGFEERDDFVHEIGVFKCAVPPLLFDGLRRYYDVARLAPILSPRVDRFPGLRADVGTIATRFRLGPAEQNFLRGITGYRTLARIQESSNLDRLTAGQLLATLILADELELRTDPTTHDVAPAEGSQDLFPRPSSGASAADDGGYIVAEYLRMKGKSDAEVLRVTPGASRDEVERAFAEGERRFGPDATRALPAQLARKASEIFALMRASRDRMLATRRR